MTMAAIDGGGRPLFRDICDMLTCRERGMSPASLHPSAVQLWSSRAFPAHYRLLALAVRSSAAQAWPSHLLAASEIGRKAKTSPHARYTLSVPRLHRWRPVTHDESV